MKATDDHVDDWLIQSLCLDLAYDEESPGCFLEHANDLEPAYRETLLKTGEIAAEVPRLEELVGRSRKKQSRDPQAWFRAFLILKSIRVADGLKFNRCACEFANATPSMSYESLEQARKQRELNLETVSWRCAAALDALRSAAPNASIDNSEKEPWPTLIALFHSEFCASATPELSFAMAQRYRALFSKKRERPKRDDVFQWIAQHNVGRGQAHLGNHLDAARNLDFYVDVTIHERGRRYMATADLAEDSRDVGIGDTPQEAVRAALKALGEPYASEMAEGTRRLERALWEI